MVNRPDPPGGGIDREKTEVIFLDRDGGREQIPLTTKSEIAVALLNRVAALLDRKER